MNKSLKPRDVAASLQFAVAIAPDGVRTLTIFEGERAATIELSPGWASELALLLIVSPDQGNDGDDGTALKLLVPVLTKEEPDSLDHLGPG